MYLENRRCSISKFHHLTIKKIGGDWPVRTQEFIDGAIKR